MLGNAYDGSSSHVFALKCNIFSQNSFVVTSSLYGNVTSARFLQLHKYYFFKILRENVDACVANWFQTC